MYNTACIAYQTNKLRNTVLKVEPQCSGFHALEHTARLVCNTKLDQSLTLANNVWMSAVTTFAASTHD